jgi:hypothetical protein
VLFRAAVDEAQHKLAPANVLVATFRTNLGIALMERADLKAAEPLLRDSLTICRKSRVPVRPTAAVPAAYGRLLIAKGALDAAAPMLDESLSLRQAQFGRNHPLVADSLLALSALFLARG